MVLVQRHPPLPSTPITVQTVISPRSRKPLITSPLDGAILTSFQNRKLHNRTDLRAAHNMKLWNLVTSYMKYLKSVNSFETKWCCCQFLSWPSRMWGVSSDNCTAIFTFVTCCVHLTSGSDCSITIQPDTHQHGEEVRWLSGAPSVKNSHSTVLSANSSELFNFCKQTMYRVCDWFWFLNKLIQHYLAEAWKSVMSLSNTQNKIWQRHYTHNRRW